MAQRYSFEEYQLHCAVTHFEQNFTKLVPDSIRCFIIGE